MGFPKLHLAFGQLSLWYQNGWKAPATISQQKSDQIVGIVADDDNYGLILLISGHRGWVSRRLLSICVVN